MEGSFLLPEIFLLACGLQESSYNGKDGKSKERHYNSNERPKEVTLSFGRSLFTAACSQEKIGSVKE